MSDYRRRRFLTDLLFVGGALAAAAGLASTGEAQSHTPAPKPSSTCKTPEQLPMPGEPVALPTTSQSPQNYPPAGAPMPVNFNKPIKADPPPAKNKKPH